MVPEERLNALARNMAYVDREHIEAFAAIVIEAAADLDRRGEPLTRENITRALRRWAIERYMRSVGGSRA